MTCETCGRLISDDESFVTIRNATTRLVPELRLFQHVMCAAINMRDEIDDEIDRILRRREVAAHPVAPAIEQALREGGWL